MTERRKKEGKHTLRYATSGEGNWKVNYEGREGGRQQGRKGAAGREGISGKRLVTRRSAG